MVWKVWKVVKTVVVLASRSMRTAPCRYDCAVIHIEDRAVSMTAFTLVFTRRSFIIIFSPILIRK
jgi:hypothetical protein